ncbi:hypothetical protein [Aquimarina muelleri]|nr:hypothetical protein [Aquimarina muelleri]
MKKEEKAINFNTLSEGNYTEKDTITLPTNTTKSKKTKNRVPYTESQLDSMNLFSALGHKLTIYNTHYISTKQISPNIALDSLKHKKTWYNKYLYKRSIKASNFGSNPTELIEFIFSKLPFIIFFFLPIFTLCMWALYSRQSFSYMEHMVFIFHIQTIFFILMGIAISIKEITKSEIINGITTLFFLFYLYKAMRKFYEQKRGKTIVKFVLVNILFFILAGIGSTLTLIGSMFIF